MKRKNILWIGLGAALAAAAAIFFIKKKNEDRGNKPPKNAPQLDIKNPGEQSEFITSASESELG